MTEEKHKDDRKKWWNNDLKFTLAFTALGIVVGYLSFVISSPLRAVVLSIVIFIGAALLSNKLVKISEGKGWWFSKFAVYLLIWFVTWTAFHTSCSVYNTFCL